MSNDNRLASEENISAVATYLASHTVNLYFHEYQLCEILLSNFLSRFSRFTNYGLCYMVSGMMMLAFQDNPTTRIVRAFCDDDRRRHSWMEFCFNDVWYVIDPLWWSSCLVYQSKYYEATRPEIYCICDHSEFWSYPISSQFAEKMRAPATSHLFYELLDAYSWYPDCDCPFHPEIKTKRLDDDDGRHTVSIKLFIEYPEITFSQEICNELMRDKRRLSPNWYTVRKVHCLRETVLRDYRRYLKERISE